MEQICVIGEEWVAQMHEKEYAEPYLADGRPIWLVGLSFDSKTRHLVDCAAVCQKGKVPF